MFYPNRPANMKPYRYQPILAIIFFLFTPIMSFSSFNEVPVAQAQTEEIEKYSDNGKVNRKGIVQKAPQGKNKGVKKKEGGTFWMIVSTLLSGFFWIGIFLFKRMRQGKLSFRRTDISNATLPKGSLQKLTDGTQTATKLGQAMFIAIRQGSFNGYRLLFSTPMEMTRSFSNERAQAYQNNVVNQAHLQNHFQQLKSQFPQGNVNLEEIETSTETVLKTITPSNEPTMGIARLALVVKSEQGELTTIEVGSCIRFPRGWKILTPKLLKP